MIDNHECKFEEEITGMASDLKVLVAEFRQMNGKLLETRSEIKEHCKESIPYRKKIDEIWAGIAFSKWIIGLVLGTGLAVNVWMHFSKG